jgi:hypothetical protein
MKNFIAVNVINVIALAFIVIIGLVTRNIPLFLILLILWFAYVVYANYDTLVAKNDIISALKHSDKRGHFKSYIADLVKAYNAITYKQEYFSKYEPDSSVYKTYDLLLKRIESNIKKATNFIEGYNYQSNQSTEYIKTICLDSTKLVEKLNNLSELVLKVDDTSSDVDITYVDDMLISLREVLNDEEPK